MPPGAVAPAVHGPCEGFGQGALAAHGPPPGFGPAQPKAPSSNAAGSQRVELGFAAARFMSEPEILRHSIILGQNNVDIHGFHARNGRAAVGALAAKLPRLAAGRVVASPRLLRQRWIVEP